MERSQYLFAQTRDFWLAGLLFAVGVWIGASHFSTFLERGGRPSFYQAYFGPAVLLVCGHGYTNPRPQQVPRLTPFLQREVDTFVCEDLPRDIPARALTGFHRFHRYLLSSVAGVWSLSGISWSKLGPLFGVFCGLIVSLTYGIFRLGMGRLLAALGALLIAVSPLNLTYLPHLRDYAKAPFILAIMLILGVLVTQPFKRFTLLGLAAVYGAVLGIGFGFRTDLLITVLPFILVLFFFVPTSIRSHLGLKVGALVVFVMTFVASAWPILNGYAAGNNIWHYALLGLMSHFDGPLGIAGSVYEWGHKFNDGFTLTLVNSYADRILQMPKFITLASAKYASAGAQYFFEIVKNFPADILLRAYAAVLKVVELPFQVPALALPAGGEDSWLIAVSAWRKTSARALAGAGLWFVGGVLLMVSTVNMRKALFLLLFVVYFAGYPAIQFSTRHYFHLEFLSWWALGFLLQTAFSAIIMITRKNGRQLLREQLGRPQDWWARAVRLIGFGGGAILLLSGSLWLLRTYQHGHVVQLIHTHIAADKEVLSSNQTTLENGRLLIHSPSVGAPLKQRPAGHEPVSTEYLAVEFDPARCHATKIALTIRYQAKKRHHDFSRGLTVDLSDEDTGPAYFFFPVFSFSAWTPSIFQGIEIDQQQAECFQALYRVEDPSQFPILLNLTLPPNWEQAQLYHTLVE